MLDFPLQDRVGLEAYGVAISFFLQYSVQRWIGEGRIATKKLGDVQVAISLDHGQQHSPPELCTGVIAASQHRSFQVAELIEQEQRMVAVAFKVPIVRRALLLSVGFTD